MALDIINNIVEAESKAEEIIKNAGIEAASIKAQAEKKGVQIVADVVKESKERLNSAADAAVKESREAVNEILNQAEIDCGKIKGDAYRRKDETVKAVIGKVVGTYGNS